MRALGYARLSVARDESTSIEKQHDAIRAKAKALGAELVGIVDDPDVSATKARLNRPGLNEVRARLARREADVVIFYRLDRVARNVGDVSTLLDEGMVLVSATEDFDVSTTLGKAMVQIASVFAGMESAATSARVTGTRRKLLQDGRWPSGTPVYGYRKARPAGSSTGWTLEHDPEEAAVVRRIVDAVLSGQSRYSIADELSREGIHTRRGAPWDTTAIKRLVRSRSLLGQVVLDGDVLRDDRGLPRTLFPPLVSAEEHARLLARTEPRQVPTGGARTTHGGRLLAGGVGRCGTCGGPLSSGSRRKGTLPVYYCGARVRGRRCERPVLIDAERCEAQVADRFLASFGRLPLIVLEERTSDPEGLAAVEAALRDAAAAIVLPGADVVELSRRIAWLQGERARIQSLPQERELVQIEDGRTFGDAWEASDTTARRSLLRSAGATVYVAPAGRRGRWDPDRIALELEPDYED